MKTDSTFVSKNITQEGVHPHGPRLRARARRMLRGLVMALTVALPCGTLRSVGAAPLHLGTAADFGALAGGAISGTGDVAGNVGSGSGAIAPAITSTGTIHPTGHATVMTALDDFAAAFNEGLNRTPDVLLSAAAYDLGGTTLAPGVHKIGAAATLTSPVTLDAGGDPDAVFIIQITGALGSTAGVGNVVLTNNAQSANVFWIVEGAVSMGAGTHLEGTVLGGAAMAFGATTTLNGRALAGAAAGTIGLSTTIITVPVAPSVVGDRVWFDADGNGVQSPAETNGFSAVPVSLLRVVLEGLTLDLGTAANFGALAGGAISGSGDVAGDVGSGSGAIAPAITSTGTVQPTGAAAVMAALHDFATAYQAGLNRTPDVVLSTAAHELGGTTLTPGTYKIGAAATMTSPVTLDAGGNPDGVFILQITGALGSTAGVGNVVLTNNAQSANIFWIVEGGVSLGAGTHLEGNILGGAAITFGASTTLNGRALAGAAAGTISLASTTLSAVTGTPPVGNPPPIAVADTVTDADGNYLFEGVPPGTYLVRWDLSSVTNDYAITPAQQGGDDALDSDSASGDVGGFVLSPELVILGGTTNLGVDLGLLETLPAIKAAATNALGAALMNLLLANDYASENWTALMAAKASGDSAILAATDPAGVATAKDAALAAMDAVPTFAETLAASKASALADLATALGTHLETDYTPENWTALQLAKTQGDEAIQAATDPADVAAARDAALETMAAVPLILAMPIFTDITRTAEGAVTLVFSTTPHYSLTLETSTNLVEWTAIATMMPGTESASFVHDAALATGPRRFYRAFLSP